MIHDEWKINYLGKRKYHSTGSTVQKTMWNKKIDKSQKNS